MLTDSVKMRSPDKRRPVQDQECSLNEGRQGEFAQTGLEYLFGFAARKLG
jgi:hypothetical protein